MADPLLLLLMYFGGTIVGLTVGIVRRHGLLWTTIDTVVAAILGFLFPVFLFGAMVVLWWHGAIVRWAESSLAFRSTVQGLMLFSPLVGAIVALLLVRSLRRRCRPQ